MRDVPITRPAWAWGRNGELTPHVISVSSGPVTRRYDYDPHAFGVDIHVYSKRGEALGTSPIDLNITATDALALARAIIAECACVECGEPLTVEGSMDPADFATNGADPVHVFCDLCGKAEHPADLTPDWNGETGNHRSCERNAR